LLRHKKTETWTENNTHHPPISGNMFGSGGPDDCPEILGFEHISGPLPSRAVAEAEDWSLSGTWWPDGYKVAGIEATRGFFGLVDSA
jgi:hypothetical protein